MEWYLPMIWAGLIGTAVAMYVVLDGFDLGVGILFPFAADERQRDQMMRSVAPFWDGNETWLILGGAGLFVAFPRAYAVIMPALYLPVIVMLLALVFRGVAFEFRTVSRSKTWLNVAFATGSALAAFAQGVILGGLIQGVKIENGAYAGGALDWATPFAFLCGLALIAGYGLLGATWLTMKTEGPVAERGRRQAKIMLLAVLVFMGAVSLWTPLAEPRIAARWFSLPNFYFLWPVPAVTALVAFACWRWIGVSAALPIAAPRSTASSTPPPTSRPARCGRRSPIFQTTALSAITPICGRWGRWGRAAIARKSSTTRVRTWSAGRPAARTKTATASSNSGTWCSCSSSRWTRTPASNCPSRPSTPAWGSSASPPSCRASPTITTPICSGT
jgi:cytochrome d ubiquinol oxidase subunit II